MLLCCTDFTVWKSIYNLFTKYYRLAQVYLICFYYFIAQFDCYLLTMHKSQLLVNRIQT